MQAGAVVAGRFEVEAEIAAGAAGRVFRARDRTSGKTVALKVLADPSGAGAERLEREARILEELRHPGIVAHVAHGTAGDDLWVALEWLEGETLEARLARGVLSVDETLAVARGAADALAAAHARGIVHRDVTPANLFLVEGRVEEVRVLDFGVARATGGVGETATGVVLGTPGYMAPEQAHAERSIDARADVFGLGSVLYRCLEGEPPFAGADPRVFDSPPLAVPEAPRWLEALVLRMIAIDPRDRPADAEVASALASPVLPPRFEPLEILGSGGSGRVVRCRDRELDREVAVKVLAPAQRQGAAGRERFAREARAVAALDHPGIVRVHDVDAEAGLLVMELAVGGSLADLVRARGALDWRRATDMLAPALSGLAAAHRAGIVHRDVKPANVLVGEGAAKLCDFGIAQTDDAAREDGARSGTPAYMAPELFRGERADERADVWSMGATYYELVTGRPFAREPALVHRDPARALSRAGVPDAVAAALARAIDPDPARRPADAGALEQDLAHAARRSRSRKRFVLPMSVGALALAATGAWLLSRSGQSDSPRTVAFLPFENETGDPSLDFVAHGIPRTLGERLSDRAGATVVAHDALLDLLGPGRHAAGQWNREAKRAGASIAVDGDVRRAAKGSRDVHVTLRLHALVGTPDELGEAAVDGPREDLDALLDEAAGDLAMRLYRGAERRQSGARPSRSLEALRSLELGIDAIGRTRFDDAAGHLERAVAVEPDLGEAWYWLAVARSWQVVLDDRAVLEAVDHAARFAHRRRERVLLEAIRLRTERRFEAAARLLEDLRADFPRDRDVLYLLGEVRWHGGDIRRGIDAFRADLAVAPGFLPPTIHLLRAYRATRNEEGLRTCIELLRRSGRGGAAEGHEMLLLFALGRFDDALRLVRAASAEAAPVAHGVQVAIDLVRGDDASARAALESDPDWTNPADSVPWSAATVLAAMAYRTGDRAGAVRASERAAAVAARIAEPFRRGDARAALGLVRALAGDVEGARAELAAAEAEPYPPTVPKTVLALRAVLAPLLGRPDLLADARASLDRDVRGLAEGIDAEMNGDSARAASLLAAALYEPTEGYLDIVMRHALARSRNALGDVAGTRAACHEIERPAAYHPWREPALADCTRWSAR